jgi:hypothetical protein
MGDEHCYLARCMAKRVGMVGKLLVRLLATAAPRARIFKRLRGRGVSFKQPIPPAYVAWRTGTITLFLLGS